jgi:ubiquinone/menaquinone biosynthesis C-methylase UbiE
MPSSHLDTPLSRVIDLSDWEGGMGERWLRNLDAMEALLSPIGDALLRTADFQPSETVLEIGCGGGALSLEIARVLNKGGALTGVDINVDLAATALKRAKAAGIINANFIATDASKTNLKPQAYDRLCSRFGVMFFDDPLTALSHVRTLIKPKGQIDMAVWGSPFENPWMISAALVAKNYVDVPPYVPRAPGPFAFEDRDYFGDILKRAGFKSTEFTPLTGQLNLGSDAKFAQEFVFEALSVGQIIKSQSGTLIDKIAGAVRDHFEAHYQEGKGVLMDYKAWLVRAES